VQYRTHRDVREMCGHCGHALRRKKGIKIVGAGPPSLARPKFFYELKTRTRLRHRHPTALSLGLHVKGPTRGRGLPCPSSYTVTVLDGHSASTAVSGLSRRRLPLLQPLLLGIDFTRPVKKNSVSLSHIY
jgi:hypothetical protein